MSSHTLLPMATSSWDDRELAAVKQVMDSGMCTMGKRVQQFETQFASFVGSKYGVMVNSGSSANLLAVAALFYCKENALQPGDEVIVPAVSWATTYSPLAQYGLKLVFIDIDLKTLNMDLDQLQAAINHKTRAVFAVNLLGNPIDYNKMSQLLNGKNIWLIEDNCESLGATLDGKQTGTFGAMGTYSTYFSHHITTVEGGFVVTDDEEFYHILLSLRSHGWTRHLPDDNKVSPKTGKSFYDSFNFVLPGYNLRPTDINGAIGIEQLKKLPSLIMGRRKNAAIFQQLFSDIKGISIQHETGESSWFGFAILVQKGKEKRDELVALFTKNGVDTRPIVAGNFVRNSVVKYFDYKIHGELKNSDFIHDCGFFIGNHHWDLSKELKVIADLLKSNM